MRQWWMQKSRLPWQKLESRNTFQNFSFLSLMGPVTHRSCKTSVNDVYPSHMVFSFIIQNRRKCNSNVRDKTHDKDNEQSVQKKCVSNKVFKNKSVVTLTFLGKFWSHGSRPLSDANWYQMESYFITVIYIVENWEELKLFIEEQK